MCHEKAVLLLALLTAVLVPELSSGFVVHQQAAPVASLTTSSSMQRLSAAGRHAARCSSSAAARSSYRTGRRGLSMEASAAAAATEVNGAVTQKDKPATKLRILSGVQPTGSLHLGNYLGAIKQWVAMQEDGYENFFCAVDLHAITVPHDPKKLKEDTLCATATYLAAGVDPSRSKIFIQSHISAHAELTWLLNCMTPMSWLERMIQYKEKARKQGENVGVGLFDYPVLMAADILLYQADQVPVGEDQRQHLELTRDIARRFNDQYCKRGVRRVFKEPNALILSEGARVMSLQDGTSKMSKSDPNEASRINLTDTADVIARKIKKCKTDAGYDGLEWGNPDRPECTNLLTMYQAVTGKSKEDILAEVSSMRWGDFKPILADATVAHIVPIQQR
eukprot:1687-Heterococcus_DN1.PRE.1